MASLADENHPAHPRLVGTTGDLYQGSIAETAIKERTVFDHSPPSQRERPQTSHAQNERNHFKSAQWSPDGTTILTSSADNILRSFILPPDLLTRPHPRPPLEPYALHHSPEPVYATAIHPSYDLREPSTCLALASPRSLPIRLFSPFAADRIVASYPLVSPTTEAWTCPHSLLVHPQDVNALFAGSESCVSVFDLQRDGDGPVTRMRTTPSRRGGRAGGPGHGHGHGQGQGQGMKGIVSALGMSCEGMLAAGTYSRWVGLYDGFGRGGDAGVFPVGADAEDDDEVGRGGGITQVVWSPCGRYLCVAERASDGVGVWDVRGTRKRLAWLRGRNAKTQQRLGVEVTGKEVWAGGSDGVVRVWEGLGLAEGVVDPSGWQFRAHGDAVSSATLHTSGSVLATCSGQRHSSHRASRAAVDDLGSESDDDRARSSSLNPLRSTTSLSSTCSSPQRSPEAMDSTLKLWAL